MSDPDPHTREDADLDHYLARLDAVGIRRVVLRRTHEHRPRPGTHIVERLRRCEVLGYRDAILYRCVLEGADALEVARALAARGLEVRLASGNIT